MRTCPHCGCGEIDEDAARGDATCMGCGTVLEESIVVSENQFQERSGGSGHTLVGQFVSAERAAAQNVHGLGSQESREMTYQKGRKVIEEIASQLRINQHCIDTAFNFFKMCVIRNLTRGRMRVNVVASCMYMTCRLENTAHLLLDFSDVTQVNVFDLGRTLSFLTRSLRINLPSTDPCLYIMRFACMLEFGEKQKEVVNLATRLVQRMKRDWMSTGRRPTGLCGAALLIAARSMNFNRTISDVVRVVHISESVVRKRLDEFSQTPSGSLTIDEFSTVDLEHNEDPPAYREARRKAQEEQMRREAEQAEQMHTDLQPVEEELEKALEKKRREKFKNTAFAKLVGGTLEGVGKAEDELVRSEVLDTVYGVANEEPGCSNDNFEMFRPSLESLGIRRNATAPEIEIKDLPMKPPQEEDNLDDISDSEIDTYILTEQEAQMKEKYWMKTNGEAMKMIEQRKRARDELEEKEKDNPNKKKRKPRVRGTNAGGAQPTSAADAIGKVIHEKKLSNKVNYDILKEIDIKRKLLDQPSVPSSDNIVQHINDLVKVASSDSKHTTEIRGHGTAAPENLTNHERSMARRNVKKSTAAVELQGVLDAVTSLADDGVKSEVLTPMKTSLSPTKNAARRRPSCRLRVLRLPKPDTDTLLKSPTDVKIPIEAVDSVVGKPAIKSRYNRLKPNLAPSAKPAKPPVAEKTERTENADDEKSVSTKEAECPQFENKKSSDSSTNTCAETKTVTKSRYVRAKPNTGLAKMVTKSPVKNVEATPVVAVEEPQEKKSKRKEKIAEDPPRRSSRR
ncbi:unnamed protein product [Caenorhabditis auriculariae]|uniref:B-related factor 1 n=1 Tax=Caenorhabditis auriculariae TaxID=2777116 RepID=A0A8S1HWQ3_9PELO|nr:unnamed protein product [Caenorhabditis auriculariae]